MNFKIRLSSIAKSMHYHVFRFALDGCFCCWTRKGGIAYRICSIRVGRAFCKALQRDYCRKILLVRISLWTFLRRDIILGRSRIFYPCSWRRIYRLLRGRSQILWPSNVDGLFYVNDVIQVILLKPFLTYELIPRAYSNSEPSIGLKQQ